MVSMEPAARPAGAGQVQKPRPVQLLVCCEDPRRYMLHVTCANQVGFLFRFCWVLLEHTLNIVSAEITSEAEELDCRFWLRRPGGSELNHASPGECLGQELEDFALQYASAEPPKPEDPRTLEWLAVNPDLLSVSVFSDVTSPTEALSEKLRYELEVRAINQAGALAYLALVLFWSHLNIVRCRVSMPDNGTLLAFVLSTESTNAQQELRTYLDLPTHVTRSQSKSSVGSSPLLNELSQMFSTMQASSESPCTRGCSTSMTDKQGQRQDRSIEFANGDTYEGQWLDSGDGGEPHGYGTYHYRSDRCGQRKQFKGQWKEGKTHGHGVLLYQEGGVYVGQFDNNQKHGLGVLLNYEDKAHPHSMPSYSYEGSWCEDQMHGLGVEETTDTLFFGGFHGGKRHGRGVQVTLGSSTSVAGCEVLNHGEWMPLLDVLQAGADAMMQIDPSSAAPSSPDMHRGWLAPLGASTAANRGGSTRDVLLRSPLLEPQLPPGAVLPSPDSPRRVQSPALLRRTISRKSSLSWMQSPQQNRQLSSPGTGFQKAPLGGCSLPMKAACSAGASAPVSPGKDPDLEFVMVEEGGAPPLAPLRGTPPAQGRPGPSPRLGSRNCSPSSQSPRRRAGSWLRALTPGRDRAKRPITCPMLWSEDELAAFLCCLGVGPAVVGSVLRRKLKGVHQFLQISDIQMQKEFGLTTPVERLLVRKSLRFFLEFDRAQNTLPRHRLADAMHDAILRDFIIPLDELQIDSKIAQGGFGLVYCGKLRPSVKRGKLEAGGVYKVAVKDIKGDASLQICEVLKESRVMASMNHPNLCNFIGICSKLQPQGGTQYILSELMDCSLFDLVHNPDSTTCFHDLTMLSTLDLAEGACDGIGYMHSMSLVHADLKSPNILIDHTSSDKLIPKICDFGHAAVRAHSASHSRCGTPHWAAPEALRKEAIGPESDVFSFGVILWEILAQTLPHQHLTSAQVVGAVGWSGWLPDMDLLPEVPVALKELLLQCLGFVQMDRPAARELQLHLRMIKRRARKKALSMLTGFLVGEAC